MSSEMRELIAKWRAVAEKQRGMASRDNERGDLEYAARMAGMAERTEYMADELEALLARTEAGADGAVDSRAAFERWAKPQGYRLHIRDIPGSARLGQYGDDSTQAAWEAWTASRATHPQDASGDAVDWKDEYRFQRAMRYMDNNDELTKQRADEMADEDIRRIEAHAMQAKEAK